MNPAPPQVGTQLATGDYNGQVTPPQAAQQAQFPGQPPRLGADTPGIRQMIEQQLAQQQGMQFAPGSIEATMQAQDTQNYANSAPSAIAMQPQLTPYLQQQEQQKQAMQQQMANRPQSQFHGGAQGMGRGGPPMGPGGAGGPGMGQGRPPMAGQPGGPMPPPPGMEGPGRGRAMASALRRTPGGAV